LKHAASLLTAGFLLVLAHPASALEYRSTGRATILYDAPSTAAGKVAIAGSGLPLEVVVDTDAWIKVRDASGRLSWVEKSALGGAKTIMVKAEISTLRKQPRADAEVVTQVAAACCSTSPPCRCVRLAAGQAYRRPRRLVARARSVGPLKAWR